jgi:hypothetical protein
MFVKWKIRQAVCHLHAVIFDTSSFDPTTDLIYLFDGSIFAAPYSLLPLTDFFGTLTEIFQCVDRFFSSSTVR